jgi:hypothetical protein
MTIQVEELWNAIAPMLHRLGEGIVRSRGHLKYSVGRSANTSFPLRAYVAIQGFDGGREVSVTIDLLRTLRGMDLSSDVGYDDGKVIATGPTLQIDASDVNADQKLADWLSGFADFLRMVEPKITTADGRL